MILRIGLTGSIGMGKSTVADYFRELNIPVFDADKAVHELYSGKAVPVLEQVFPSAIVQDEKNSGQKSVDRKALSKIVTQDPAQFAKLEALIHPLVRAEREDFLAQAQQAGAEMAVLEIPLLFESSKGDPRPEQVDVVLVVSAPLSVQRERVLARPNMSAEKFETILAQQMPDAEKREKADYIVDTSLEIAETRREIDQIIASLRSQLPKLET